MKYSVCIDMLYGGRPLEPTLREVAAHGFDTIEFWSWQNKDLDAMERLTKELGLSISCMNTVPAPLNDPAGHDAFLRGLEQTVPVAKRLGVKKLLTTVGMDAPEISHTQQLFNIEDGLRKTVPILEDSDLILMIEPLNTLVDHRGYSLPLSTEAYSILNNIPSRRVMMLFDIYHQQIAEGSVCANITRCIDRIGHFHTAGSRVRGPLDDGELNYAYVFKTIRDAGYDGCIGLEYHTDRPDMGFSALPMLG